MLKNLGLALPASVGRAALVAITLFEVVGCASIAPLPKGDLTHRPPLEIDVVRFCSRVNLCTWSEEVVVSAQCRNGRIQSVTFQVDHYFNYRSASGCEQCRRYLQNDGIVVQQGEQGYCRFDQFARPSDVPDPESAPCVRDPDELNKFCGRSGTIYLDRYTQRRSFIPCNYYGAPDQFPPKEVVCR
jgi:hypothetical protein